MRGVFEVVLGLEFLLGGLIGGVGDLLLEWGGGHFGGEAVVLVRRVTVVRLGKEVMKRAGRW